MRAQQPSSDLLASLDALRDLTTFCKRRDIVFMTGAAGDHHRYQTSPCNAGTTRWLGLLKQATLYCKCHSDVEEKARDNQEMSYITQRINWQILNS